MNKNRHFGNQALMFFIVAGPKFYELTANLDLIACRWLKGKG